MRIKPFLFVFLSFLFFSYVHPALAFDSNTVSGLVSWVKADSEPLSNGSTISVIHDRSNNAHDYSGSGATYSTNYLNGQPTFSFNATGGFLNSGFSVNGVDVFIVGNNPGSTGNAGIFTCQASVNSSNDYQSGGLLGWTVGNAGSEMIDVSYNGTCNIDQDCVLTNISHSVNPAGVMEYQVDNSTKNASISWNNILVKATTYINPVYPLTLGQCAIGARLSPSLTLPFTGHILETLVFDHTLSSSDKNTVLSYLQGKYGINLLGPTPTPTPTPSPTPSPTPTPIPVTKVVVVPGLGGSWNKDAILHCKADNYSGTWTSWPVADTVYNPIINALNASGFTAKPFYYDWRKQIPDTAPLLTNFINTNVVPNEKVDIVGHSMGGLVGRAYVEKEKGGNKADKLMTVGTPHQGTLLAYPAWSNGEIWGSFLWKIAATIATKSCKSIGLSDREIVQRFMPSAQNMLPTFDYLKDLKTGTTKPIANMNAQNNWLDPNLPPLFINTTVGTLSGFGVNTLQFMSVINPSRRDQTLGNWLDGRPVKREYTIQGDGAVLTVSTMLSGAINKQISQDHVGIIASTEGVDEILRFLSGAILSTSIPKTTAREPKSALVIIGDPANFWVVADGKTIKDTDGLVVITDPKTGLYTLRLLPKTTSTKIIVAQFLEGDRVLWKEYQWKSIFPKFGTIKFDASNPIEDALK